MDKTKQKFHTPTKFALWLVIAGVAGVFGWRSLSAYLIDGIKFEDLQPGRVNLIGINPGSGFRIIVANQIAQLTQGDSGEFDAPDALEDRSSVGDRRRIPLRDMLESLQGNEKSLGNMIRVLNRISDSDIPEEQIWDAADIDKALKGDKVLLAKLEKDLSVDLDGKPLSETSSKSIENGIGIRLSVPVTVRTSAGPKLLHGKVLVEYKPSFISGVWDRIKDKFDLNKETIAGYFADEAAKLAEHPERQENVRDSLQAQISDKRIQSLAMGPQKVLSNAQVVVTENHMVSASKKERDYDNGRRLFDLVLDLNDEGRKRLWQFSKRRIGDQLLVVSDGVAIAAPRIEHELAQSEVTINKLPDEGLVNEVVEIINTHGGGQEGK